MNTAPFMNAGRAMRATLMQRLDLTQTGASTSIGCMCTQERMRTMTMRRRMSGRTLDDETNAEGNSSRGNSRRLRSTTVLCVRRDGHVVLVADGQMTLGSEVVKANVRKLRRLAPGVIGGFAGATTDAFTLFERLEQKLEESPGHLMKAAVDLARQWRTDRYLRRLDATMVVADKERSLTITGDGNVIEANDGVVAIGSGGGYALAAARALMQVDGLSARHVADRAMKIAADMCIYTNHNFIVEELDADGGTSPTADSTASQKEEEKKDAHE